MLSVIFELFYVVLRVVKEHHVFRLEIDAVVVLGHIFLDRERRECGNMYAIVAHVHSIVDGDLKIPAVLPVAHPTSRVGWMCIHRAIRGGRAAPSM